MLKKRTCLLPAVCFLTLFLVGCSAFFHKQVQTEPRPDNRLLEKKIDDLTGKMNLVVSDANMLHSELEVARTYNTIMQQKIDGLEAMVMDLSEQINRLNLPVTIPPIVPSHAKNTSVVTNVLVAEGEPSVTPASRVYDPENTETLLAVANGFWDAMNAKDIQTAMSYVTKESGDKLQIKDTDDTAKRKVTFGEVKTEDNKASIETTMQTHPETSESETRLQTILVKEDGQWRVDVGQTIASIPEGGMGEIMQSIGKAMETEPVIDSEDGEKALAAGMQKGLQEMQQSVGDTQANITPPKQETTVITEIDKQTEEAGAAHQDVMPEKHETADIAAASEPAQRESFLKENIVRLAEKEFPDQKGLQWNIVSFEHKAHLTYAEVEPTPPTIGYPRIKLAVSFKNPETPRVIGTYGFQDGQYSLLSTKKN